MADVLVQQVEQLVRCCQEYDAAVASGPGGAASSSEAVARSRSSYASQLQQTRSLIREWVTTHLQPPSAYRPSVCTTGELYEHMRGADGKKEQKVVTANHGLIEISLAPIHTAGQARPSGFPARRILCLHSDFALSDLLRPLVCWE